MKHLISLLGALILVFSLTGCSRLSEDGVEFFYCRNGDTFQFGADDGIIAAETRNLTSSGDDLAYLLSIYLRGPQDSQLRSPFPAGCKLTAVMREGDTLNVTLDAPFALLENLDLTLACACLSKTCLELTDASQISIHAESPEDEKSIAFTIHRDQLLLEDLTALPTEINTEPN